MDKIIEQERHSVLEMTVNTLNKTTKTLVKVIDTVGQLHDQIRKLEERIQNVERLTPNETQYMKGENEKMKELLAWSCNLFQTVRSTVSRLVESMPMTDNAAGTPFPDLMKNQNEIERLLLKEWERAKDGKQWCETVDDAIGFVGHLLYLSSDGKQGEKREAKYFTE